jgi:hypothetical protein
LQPHLFQTFPVVSGKFHNIPHITLCDRGCQAFLRAGCLSELKNKKTTKISETLRLADNNNFTYRSNSEACDKTG